MARREPDIENWRVQLRKGAAELAVLGLLAREPSYGSKLLDAIADAGRLDVSEGSIYPLLKRLERDGKVKAQWVVDEGASHPRKYYTLTAHGRSIAATMQEEWLDFSQSLSTLLDTKKKG